MFKVWSKECNCWVGGLVTIFQDGTIGRYSTNVKSFDILGKDKFEIVKYTGLEDKNGKEIYEGDILKIYSPVPSKEPIIGQVYFIDGMFKVKGKRHYLINDDGISLCSFVFREVIGNIYEDKYLLEEV